VARSAELLAMRHGIDARKARIAGLLHDLARLYSGDRLIEECERRGIPIGAFERSHPVVLHAPLSAALAREAYGVTDLEILSAIEKHTLGDAHMSSLDRVVYLADSLEPGRAFAAREALWNLAQRDLHASMRETVAQSLRYLEERGLEPAPQTLAAARTFGLEPEQESIHHR
jgi:predicted HD superfamily hydrolase involved in NAD metabolism